MTQTATRAALSTWRLDPAHSSIEFSVKHMMMTTVRGRFKEFQGTLSADEEHPQGCCVDVEIKAASIDTGVPDRDAHLRAAEFFDVERYPEIVFRSRRADGKFAREGDRFRITGDLTIHGVTRPVILQVDPPSAEAKDLWGNRRMGASATTRIRRSDFGLAWNQALETGGILVGDELKLALDVSLIRA